MPQSSPFESLLDLVPSSSAAPPVEPEEEDDEEEFQRWYAEHAKKNKLNPDPDFPGQFYDYRAAFRAGAAPDAEGHWPSEFKRVGHPNRFVEGIDTITGKPARPVDVAVNDEVRRRTMVPRAFRPPRKDEEQFE